MNKENVKKLNNLYNRLEKLQDDYNSLQDNYRGTDKHMITFHMHVGNRINMEIEVSVIKEYISKNILKTIEEIKKSGGEI